MATIDSRWHPGIGDPTFIGWITVGAYAWVAWCAFQRAKNSRTGPTSFWWLVFACVAALGINKQLDLQTWFTEVARDAALQQGWYADRQRYQLAFIVVLAALGASALLVLAKLYANRLEKDALVALAGLTGLVVFVLVRASSFHHVDRWLGASWGPMKWNHVMELSALAVVGWGCRVTSTIHSRATTHPNRQM